MHKIILVLALSLLAFGQLESQIITDRPDQTESSSTVGLGNLQIESGFLIGYNQNQDHTERQILAPTNLFRYGITQGIELRLLSQFETFKANNTDVQGISDLEIGTKIQIYQPTDKNIEIAFLSHLIVPTGTTGLSIDELGTINKLSISHILSERLGLAYNVGYDYFGFGAGDLTYSLAFGVSVNDAVGIYIEPYGALADFEKHVSNFDAGFTYLANENVQLDFSFGTGINQKMNYLSVGVSWLIHRKP